EREAQPEAVLEGPRVVAGVGVVRVVTRPGRELLATMVRGAGMTLMGAVATVFTVVLRDPALHAACIVTPVYPPTAPPLRPRLTPSYYRPCAPVATVTCVAFSSLVHVVVT